MLSDSPCAVVSALSQAAVGTEVAEMTTLVKRIEKTLALPKTPVEGVLAGLLSENTISEARGLEDFHAGFLRCRIAHSGAPRA